MNMQILRNVSAERQEEFQGYLDAMVSQIAWRVRKVLPLDEQDAWSLVARQLTYAMGLYPIVTRVHGADATAPFSARYRDFLATLLAGMRVQLRCG